MRSLGYPQFHRRILYPRGPKPGWIAKHNWTANLTGAASIPACKVIPTAFGAASQSETRPLGSVSLAAHISRRQQLILGKAENPQSETPNPQFPDWLRRVSPNMTWSWRHQQVIIEQLERVTRGECKRLMIFLPPRHGKSELVTVRYTAWRMQRDPAMNVILGSYNQRLADRFSRKIRKVVADAEALSEPPVVTGGLPKANASISNTQLSTRSSISHSQEGRLAPSNPNPRCTAEPAASAGGTRPTHHTTRSTSSSRSITPPPPAHAGGSAFPFVSTKPANSVSEWETTMGGGFRSVGVGSGVTGFGASLIVIDDPIKSRAEAESATYRERVWDWFTDDLYTRLEPDGAIVLIQTRWHEDDLAGRLLRESVDGGEHWDVINLPALSEPPAVAGGLAKPSITDQTPAPQQQHASGNPPPTSAGSDWRPEPNLPLCPERFDLPALRRIRARLGEYSFSALYQQRPTPADGGVFKREWFKIAPFAPSGLKWKRGYDLAVSTKTNADYTASFRCAFDKEGNLYISGGLRARLEYPDQRRFIIDRIRNEPDTEHGVELALHGQALIQDLRRERGVRGHLLRGIKPDSDKLTRALTWAPLAEEGKVFLVRTSDCGLRTVPDPRRPVVSSPHGSKGSRGHSTLTGRLGEPGADVPQSAIRTTNSNWIPDFLDEVCAFPNAAHDDQVDAVSLAVQMLKRPSRRAWGF